MKSIEDIIRAIVQDELQKHAPPSAPISIIRESASRLYSVTRVAELLAVSDDYIYARIRAGELKTVELGHGRAKMRIAPTKLQAFTESRSSRPARWRCPSSV